MTAANRYIGLISGTSVDAIDAVLVEFCPGPKLLAATAVAYDADLRARIVELSTGDGAIRLAQLGELDARIGEAFAAAANTLIQQAGLTPSAIRAIGSHGQTVWHAPSPPWPSSIQLGDANVIAERTGIDTVADFRRRDLAAGGQGAPLVPAFHAAFLHSRDEDRAVLNLGGIANLSLLPAEGTVRGFDTGPASALMDNWAMQNFGVAYDDQGRYAQSGRPDTDLLQRMLCDPYFAKAAPKSTGRDYFNPSWLAAMISDRTLRAEDVQATLLALTARSIADALRREAPKTVRLLVCGGGVRNPALLQALSAALPGIPIDSTADHSIDPDYLEAMAFAWLAREALEHRPGNLPAVTGARGPRSLGALYRA